MKFKVGDKVKVIEEGTHNQEIGAICEIVHIDTKDTNMPYLAKCPNDITMWFYEKQIKLEKQFTKSNLQDGDIVTYRNGQQRTIIGEKLIDKDGNITSKMDYYKEDLTKILTQKEYEIVKVERPTQYETVFERKEEILDKVEKKYLSNVIRPFKEEVCSIKKMKHTELYRIKITTRNGNFLLPYFEKDKMYTNMQEEKEYKLEELGL